MAQPHEPLTPDNLEEAMRRREEQRRRLARIAERYEQLEDALESLESLVQQYTPSGEPTAPDKVGRPRKPR